MQQLRKHFVREQDYVLLEYGVQPGDKRKTRYCRTAQFAAYEGCTLHEEAFFLRVLYGQILQI